MFLFRLSADFYKIFLVVLIKINLEANGRVYPIKVVEEQFVVNNLMGTTCECKC